VVSVGKRRRPFLIRPSVSAKRLEWKDQVTNSATVVKPPLAAFLAVAICHATQQNLLVKASLGSTEASLGKRHRF